MEYTHTRPPHSGHTMWGFGEPQVWPGREDWGDEDSTVSICPRRGAGSVRNQIIWIPGDGQIRSRMLKSHFVLCRHSVSCWSSRIKKSNLHIFIFIFIILKIELRDFALSYISRPFLFILRQGLTKSLSCPERIWTWDSPVSVSDCWDYKHVPPHPA